MHPRLRKHIIKEGHGAGEECLTHEARDTVREPCKWNKVEERHYGRRWDGPDPLRILRPYKVWISYYVKW